MRDLIVSLITLKIHAVQFRLLRRVDGQAIGVGAGQQSRIHCTRLAGWKGGHVVHLRQHDRVLDLPLAAPSFRQTPCATT